MPSMLTVGEVQLNVCRKEVFWKNWGRREEVKV